MAERRELITISPPSYNENYKSWNYMILGKTLVEDIQDLKHRFIQGLTSIELSPYQTNSIMVTIPDSILEHIIPTLRDRNFTHHHYDIDKNTHHYMLWCNPNVDNKIPPYAVSIGGSSMLALNKDKSQVFLVFENGCFRAPGGGVNMKETHRMAGLRELKEEVGLVIPNPMLVGGYNQRSARDKKINDVHLCYAGIVEAEEIKLDDDEIKMGRWFFINEFPSILPKPKIQKGDNGFKFPKVAIDFIDSANEQTENLQFSWLTLLWLESIRHPEGAFVETTGLHPDVNVWGRSFEMTL